jgi:hypothetical protein
MTKGFRLMVTVAAFSALALGGCATLGSDGPGQSAKYGGRASPA